LEISHYIKGKEKGQNILNVIRGLCNMIKNGRLLLKHLFVDCVEFMHSSLCVSEIRDVRNI